MTKELGRILDQDSAESVMVFTDNPGIMELVSQINRLLKEKSTYEVARRTPEATVIVIRFGIVLACKLQI